MTRTNTFDAGLVAETVAKFALRARGYTILAHRYSCPVGEIDLVARRGDLLVFVEVKRRKTLHAALAALEPRQQRRIARAAEVFFRDHPQCRLLPARFDLIAVTPWMLPRHVEDVWRI